MNTSDKDKYTVPGLERGLRLLCEFSRRERTLSPPELASRLKVPRSTVFRLLSTLENMGFVERVEGGREYRLGIAILRLGFEYLASSELNELSQPFLAQLAESTGYTSNLVVRDEHSIVYVAKVSSPSQMLVSAINIGSRLPAHATIFGHVLLQDLSLPQLQQLYRDMKLESYSQYTPQTVAQLYAMTSQVAQQPYHQGTGFFEASITTIAAPVRDRKGNIVAAVGITIPASGMGQVQNDKLTHTVTVIAGNISRLLGYAPY